jgi:sarcosine oxidase
MTRGSSDRTRSAPHGVDLGADVAVIGLGAIGSMALWRLASRGARVEGYERFGVGHHRGASGGQTRRFAVVSQRNPKQTQLALEAHDLWRALERERGRNLLTLTDGLLIGEPALPAMRTAIESLRSHEVDHEVIESGELRQRFPQHAASDVEVGVVDRLTGYVRPEVSILSAVECAVRYGAAVHQHTPVVSLETSNDGVIVMTERGRRHHRMAVLAPGPWAPSLPGTAGLGVVTRRLVQAWYVPKDVAAFHSSVFPVFEHLGETRVYGFPSIDGATVKVGVYTGKPHPEVQDIEAADTWVDPAFGRGLAETVQQFLPDLRGDPVLMSVHFEGYAPDLSPLLGPVRSMPRTVVACGFSGAGFKFAPVMGDIVADYVLDGGTQRDAAFMLPDRKLPAADKRD